MKLKNIKVKTARFFKNLAKNVKNTDGLKASLVEFGDFSSDVIMELNHIYDDYRTSDELKVLSFWMIVAFVPVVFFSWAINLGIIIVLSALRGYYLRKK